MKKRRLVYKIYRKKTIERLETKIKLLGINCTYDVMKLLNMRLFFALCIFVILFIFCSYGYLWAPIVTILFYISFEKIVLDYPIRKRTKKLEYEAIFFFEILCLTIDSGKNLKSALNMTTSNIDSELSLEFKKTLAEIKLGKSLTESLDSMSKRIPSDAIHNLLLSLLQSSTLGNSFTDSLNTQLSYLREKRILDIKAEITKLPIKISVLSVVFFLPILMLLILSPAVIEFFMR